MTKTIADSLYWKICMGFAFAMIASSDAIAIDNGVIGTSVQCTADTIAVNFTTKNPFTGRIFVKGMSERPECVRNFAEGTSTPPSPVITFTFGECNMQRSRTLAPQAGMLQMIVVVISFHKIFITKVDRAFKVQCFYMEGQQTVTSQLDVSMITTESVRETSAMPTCTYAVRKGSVTGDLVRYAKVGEPVYHQWECDSDLVKILVKSCYVDDGQGNRQLILDEKGCAVDSVILSDLTYESSGNARAWVESHVFKYADKPSVFFQCSIMICSKNDAQCDSVTPPKCQTQSQYKPGQGSRPPSDHEARGLARVKRDWREPRRLVDYDAKIVYPMQSNEIDLLTETIAVLDLEDSNGLSKAQYSDGYYTNENEYLGETSVCSQSENAVCMSATGFAVLVSIVVALFACVATASIIICCGKTLCRRKGHKM